MHFQRRKQRHREVEIPTQRLPSQEGAELGLKLMSIVIKIKFPKTELHRKFQAGRDSVLFSILTLVLGRVPGKEWELSVCRMNCTGLLLCARHRVKCPPSPLNPPSGPTMR